MEQPTTKPVNQSKSGSHFSIMSILVITGVFAALSLSLGYLYRAAVEDQEMGYFIVYTAFSPLLVLFLANMLYQTVRWFQRNQKPPLGD